MHLNSPIVTPVSGHVGCSVTKQVRNGPYTTIADKLPRVAAVDGPTRRGALTLAFGIGEQIVTKAAGNSIEETAHQSILILLGTSGYFGNHEVWILLGHCRPPLGFI